METQRQHPGKEERKRKRKGEVNRGKENRNRKEPPVNPN
jgi:hypothetical protein